MFSIVKSVAQARIGRIVYPGRKVIETPHYLGITSRGVVPHITQDTFSRDTDINAVFVALEDFIERAPQKVPPILALEPNDGSSPLRKFIALSDHALTVIGARRTPPVAAPPANSNTDTSVSICTAVGFRSLDPEDYAEFAEKLRADIVVALGDIPYERALGSKRVERATDRTIQWLEHHIAGRRDAELHPNIPRSKLFASLLPVPCSRQQFYIDTIADHLHDVDGLALFDLNALEDLPPSIEQLPRLGLTTPNSPQEVLQHVSQGLDLLTIPFINTATDAGIVLTFAFPSTHASSNLMRDSTPPVPLGLDMWSPEHSADLSPLTRHCGCYACTNHHRAYIQHLLAAKEMLGWVLIQIHNHHVMDLFFDGIRRSISSGTLDDDMLTFARHYEPYLPHKTGQGPRIRGYQYKSEGPGEGKKNPATFAVLNDRKEKLAEASPPAEGSDAIDLESQGFAETKAG